MAQPWPTPCGESSAEVLMDTALWSRVMESSSEFTDLESTEGRLPQSGFPRCRRRHRKGPWTHDRTSDTPRGAAQLSCAWLWLRGATWRC
eukprot:Skav202698  [mRNA]  locus=scaffold654:303761:304030:- [translate_table: standard]